MRHVPLCNDKRASQAMLNDVLLKVERKRAGLVDPTEDQMKWPIEKHLDDFERHQKGKNNSPHCVDELVTKVRRVVNTVGWRTMAQITASDVEGFLADLREKEGLSVQPSNHYLRAIKSFVIWLVRNKRLLSNPLDGVSMLNVRVDQEERAAAIRKLGGLPLAT